MPSTAETNDKIRAVVAEQVVQDAATIADLREQLASVSTAHGEQRTQLARQKITEAKAWTYEGDMVEVRKILDEALSALPAE